MFLKEHAVLYGVQEHIASVSRTKNPFLAEHKVL